MSHYPKEQKSKLSKLVESLDEKYETDPLPEDMLAALKKAIVALENKKPDEEEPTQE